jgi:hypothetical protein
MKEMYLIQSMSCYRVDEAYDCIMHSQQTVIQQFQLSTFNSLEQRTRTQNLDLPAVENSKFFEDQNSNSKFEFSIQDPLSKIDSTGCCREWHQLVSCLFGVLHLRLDSVLSLFAIRYSRTIKS